MCLCVFLCASVCLRVVRVDLAVAHVREAGVKLAPGLVRVAFVSNYYRLVVLLGVSWGSSMGMRRVARRFWERRRQPLV